jgi:DNA replication protein DnaC
MTDTTMADATFLASLLTELRLPSSARNWRRIAESADRDGWPAQKTIAALMEIEVAERASRRIQRHRDQSEAPPGKTFASFDFDVAPGVRKQQLLSLGAGGDWIRNGDNLLLFGKSGTGKSHAMAAVCQALIDAGKRVLFTRTIDIVQRLQTARRDLSLIDALEKLDKFDLIVLDDLSYVRKDQAETSVLFELIAHRYERHSIAITANQAFSALEHRLSGRRHDCGGGGPIGPSRDDHRNEWRKLPRALRRPQSRKGGNPGLGLAFHRNPSRVIAAHRTPPPRQLLGPPPKTVSDK